MESESVQDILSSRLRVFQRRRVCHSASGIIGRFEPPLTVGGLEDG
jgi:hypothetical protein